MTDVALLIFLIAGVIWLAGLVFFKAADCIELLRARSPARRWARALRALRPSSRAGGYPSGTLTTR